MDSNTHTETRWGILGGTFDPPHLGHFQLAQSAADRYRLERVLWVPSYRPPHKHRADITPWRHRTTMTEMTARRDRRFDVSRIEETLGGESFTVKTLAHLGRALPEIRLYFVTGADVLTELSDWFKPERISRWAVMVCGVRPGYERPDSSTLPVEGVTYFEGPEVDISSSEIRRRVTAGEPIRGMVSPDVEQYIADNDLYSRSK